MKKKPKSNKGIMVVLVLLIIACVACGTIGYLESTKPKDTNEGENKETDPKDFKVTYRYYLDGEEIDDIVEKETLTLNNSEEFEGDTEEIYVYNFDRYSCTNNVTGTWNEEDWEFTPELTANSTCRLYFIKSEHTVTFKANNGILPSGQVEEKLETIINKDKTINVKPAEGYKFESISCTNNDIKTEYNEETNDVTVSNVTKDGAICTVEFGLKDYKVEVTAQFGSVVEPKDQTVKYGANVEFEVSPSENYAFETVTCTNDQHGTYVNGRLTISGVSNDTVCTVIFRPVKYTVTLNVTGGKISSGYSSPQSVSEGQKATFVVEPDEGYSMTGVVPECGENVKTEFQSGILNVYDVTNNITCNLNLKKTETTE